MSIYQSENSCVVHSEYGVFFLALGSCLLMINVVMSFILNCNVFNQNSVNDVIMLVWSPSVELNAKAELVKG